MRTGHREGGRNVGVAMLILIALTACSSDGANNQNDGLSECVVAEDDYEAAAATVSTRCESDDDCTWGSYDYCECPTAINVDVDIDRVRQLRSDAEEMCATEFCGNNQICDFDRYVAPAHPPICELGRCEWPELAEMSAEIEPTEVAIADLGSTGVFTVTATLTGDYGPVDEMASRVYIEQPQTFADPNALTQTGEGVWVFEIPYSWLSDVGAGTHEVSVEMVTEYESLFDRFFAELTITP